MTMSEKSARHIADIDEAMSIKYNNIVYEMKQKGEDVIVLSLGEAFFDIPLYPFDDLPYPALYHYSHSRGVLELRQKLAGYYGQQYGVPVNPEEEIILTAGCKLAIHMAFMALLDPGDEVIIPEPGWVTYPEQVKLCHGTPVMIPCDARVSDYGKYVTEKTKVIVLNNPHNPRGFVYPKTDLEYLYALAKERELYVLSDESYSDFITGDDEFISLGALDPEKKHVILCNSMSKNYGMSGWRIGYVITNPTLSHEILKINQHLLTCPATILQYYLAKHFDGIIKITMPQIRQVVEKRNELAQYMESLKMQFLPGSSTFYFFVSIAPSRLGSEAFCDRLLEKHHVCCVPGVGYGQTCDQWIRVSIGAESMDRTQQGIRYIHQLIQETSTLRK